MQEPDYPKQFAGTQLFSFRNCAKNNVFFKFLKEVLNGISYDIEP